MRVIESGPKRCAIKRHKHAEKILLVDSNGFIADSLRPFLVNQGCVLQISHTADSALTILQDQEFCLVLVDTNIVGMRGIDLCGHIHALYPAVGQILFVDYLDSPSALTACEAGIDDWIEKPFSISSAEKIIFRLLKNELNNRGK